jgi:ribose transport system permease protein
VTYKYAQVVLVIALVIVFWSLSPEFRTGGNWKGLLLGQSVIAITTLSVLFPLIVGEFDLSVGYNIGFVAMFGAWATSHGWSTGLVLVGMLVVGTLVGLVNGLLVVVLKINSFIATLGVGILVSALTLGLSQGNQLTTVPRAILDAGQKDFLGVPWSLWAFIVVAIVCYYVLEHTPLGAKWYAIGGSERVAFLAGIRTGGLKIAAFTVTGLIVAIAAVFQLGQAGAATPSLGPDLLLPAYAGAFLAVTTFKPGFYNVIGVIVGILLLAIGYNGLSLLGAQFWVQPLFNGVALIVAVVAARLIAVRRRTGAARH